MKSNGVCWPTTAMLVLACLLAGLAGCSGGSEYGSTAEKIRIGVSRWEPAVLIHVAEHEELFDEYGLEVELIHYPFGIDAIIALEENEVDFAISSEFAITSTSFQFPDISIIATISEMISITLVGRRDRGINSVADLRGKRISMLRGIQGHFMLGRLLASEGIMLEEIDMFEGEPGQQVTLDLALEDLITGKIDATALVEPYCSTALQHLGENAFTADLQLGQPWYHVLSARREYANHNIEVVRKLLEALIAAEEFADENPLKAQYYLHEATGMSPASAGIIWSSCRFTVALPQTLLVTLDDQAAWALTNELFGATLLPDFSRRLFLEGLKSISPERVTIY